VLYRHVYELELYQKQIDTAEAALKPLDPFDDELIANVLDRVYRHRLRPTTVRDDCIRIARNNSATQEKRKNYCEKVI